MHKLYNEQFKGADKMSSFLKEMINHKIKLLTKEELLHYAKQYGLNLSANEAEEILNYVHNNKLDVFSKKEIMKFHQKISEITNLETANKAKRLFEEVITSYGLEHLFH